MSDSIQSVGNTIVLTPAAGPVANVANVATGTNTFHFLNANATVYAYVGVFNTYTAANAMNHPSAGVSGAGIPLAPNESMSITGNFGVNPNPLTVYVAAITAAGSTAVFVTPITI
jgi:hypothetical protein